MARWRMSEMEAIGIWCCLVAEFGWKVFVFGVRFCSIRVNLEFG